MLNKIKALVLSLALTLPLSVNATEYYIQLNTGLVATPDFTLTRNTTVNSIKTDTGVVFTGSFGVRLNDVVRTELELGYNTTQVSNSTGDLEQLSLMGNIIADLPIEKVNIVPFLGVGVGLANQSVESLRSPARLDNSNTVFAYQFLAGASFKITPTLDLVGTYKHFRTVDSTDRGVSNEGLVNNMFLLGLRLSM